MRLYEIESQPNLNEVVAVLERDCSMYLNEVGGIANALFATPLWRGIRKRSVEKYGLFDRVLTVVRPQLNRKPSDTPLVAHSVFDGWFLTNFGHRYRSQAFFASGDLTEVRSNYGEPCVFFPMGNYSICWSPTISDLFKEFDTVYDRGSSYDDGESAAEDIVSSGKYTDENLPAAIRSGHEVMISCNTAYLLPEKYQHQLLEEYNLRA